MSTSEELKKIVTVARPVIDRWLDLVEELAAIRDAATQKGLDWGQIKALLKAQAQDERDDSGSGKRVTRIIEKADYAASYADMLGFGKVNKMNEQNSVSGASANRIGHGNSTSASEGSSPSAPANHNDDIPTFLDRRQKSMAGLL